MSLFPQPDSYQTRDAFADALVIFVNNLPTLHPKAAGHPAVERTTSLFEAGGIDSMGIIHIVGFLESALGEALPLQHITMKNFRTVDDIANLFWSQRKHEP